MKTYITLCLCALVFLGADCYGAKGHAQQNNIKPNKILVAYASKYGSTATVAEAIGQTFREEGAEVDVLPAKQVKNIAQYNAVVIGSGVYMGKWLKDSMRLIKQNKEVLNKMPVAYFEVCLAVREDTEANRKVAESYAIKAMALVKSVDLGIFAGVMDRKKVSFFHRLLLRFIIVPNGDFRNWDAIKAWAKQVYPRLAVK